MTTSREFRVARRAKAIEYEARARQADRSGDYAAAARYTRMADAFTLKRTLTRKQASVAIAKKLVDRGVPANLALSFGTLATAKGSKSTTKRH